MKGMNNLNYKLSIGERSFHFLCTLLMIVIVILTLYPFWYIFVASLSDPFLVAKTRGIMIWFKGFDLSSYISVFHHKLIWTSYANTIFYVVAGTAVNLVLTTFGAYSLSRRHLKGRVIIMKFLVFTMFFSGGLIPTYLIVAQCGMLNSRWALIIPNAISMYNLIIMRTAFQSVPVGIEEAAIIDGASHFKIMMKIIIPLSIPVLMVIALFYSVGHWNSFFSALIYLRDSKKYPLQLILRELLISNDTSRVQEGSVSTEQVGLTIKYATIMVATLPIICVYPFIQKYFIQGVMIGSIKE